MKIKDLKKLINKYNKILSDKYGYKCDLVKDDIKDSLDSIEALQYDCISDYEDQYVECDYIKKYLYFKYIEKDIEDFKKYESESEK